MTTIADELREEGFAKGRKSGFSEGRKSGFSEGRKSGFSEGRKSGFSEGRKRGLSEGRKRGLSEGKSLIIMNMHGNGMSISDISRVTNISTRQLKKIVEAESTCGV